MGDKTQPTKVIKWEEVQKHMEEDDIWLVIHGKVYDVSKFTTHPGGYELLVDASGYDATAPFEDNDHSVTAKETLVQYYIGEIEDGPAPEKAGEGSNLAPILVMLAVIGLLVALVFGNII